MRAAFLGLALFLATPALAQMVKSSVTAANGVEVSVHSDDFAGRYEYTAPTIKFGGGDGFAIIAAIRQNGTVKGPFISGSIMYTDREWRRYSQAILRGGEAVDATFGDRDVVSCRGSRYSGCTYREGFQIELGEAQRQRLASEGSLQIQLKGSPGSELILDVPASYFSAIEETSKGT